MTIHLPEDLEQFVAQKVANGRFASADEAITEAVRLLRQAEAQVAAPAAALAGEETAGEPVWQRVLDLMKDVPDEVFDQIPADASAQLDHYLYGTPKRPPA
jgi:putative addiction module CopG family antidote